MDHLRILAFVAQVNAAERARLARKNLEINPAAAVYMQARAAAHYKRARVALGIES